MIPKLIRITTVPLSLEKLLGGQMGYMRQNGFDVYMVSSDSPKKTMLEEKEGCPFLVVNMTRTISPFKDLISLFKLIGLLRKLKPEIVHTHTPKAGFIGMLAALYCRVPVRLHTIAGLPLMEATGLQRSILNYVERITNACAKRVYPNSKKLQEFMIQEKLCKPDKLKVIGGGSSNGIDTEFFKLTESIADTAAAFKVDNYIAPGDFVFVFIGRLVKDKGIEELVIAFKELSSVYKNIKLILVGPAEPELDPLTAECEREINENPQIIAVGYQGDVRPYLAAANALVFPSYREGFPNVPMQAGCFDLPSIVTDINGCNEIINNGENGLVVPVKNMQALKQAMQNLVDDDLLYSRLKANARKKILERYEQKKFWNLLLNEYNQQLDENKVIR
ncbi:MAG TPA: glycosyltransferase family 4 protein [Mucilaginibacter sp.]